MTDLSLGTGEVLSPVQAGASVIRQEIDTLLLSIREHETRLTSGYAQLGSALVRVQENHYWRDWGYASWGSYINFVCRQIGRQRAQIYNIYGTAQKLLPSVSEDDLTIVGISKAMELSRFVKQSGLRVPQHLLDLAKLEDTTVEQLRAAVLEELHEKCDEKGKWYAFPGFYATSDERKEIEEAFRLSKALDPPSLDSPEHVQVKDAVLKWVREFVGTYAAEENQL